MKNKFDIIVIGGGHAGIEASYAAARMGCETLLVTMSTDSIGRLSCNPSIGGSAKGHLVKELDALGGIMGVLADKSGLQFKTLNKSKGPAIWSPRSQNDKDLYPLYAQQTLLSTPGLSICEASVEEILVEEDAIKGIRTTTNELIYSSAVVLCTGTFLNAVMHTGLNATAGGRVGEPAAHKISDLLNSYGLERGRLKTGTPPRIHKDSIDYSKLSPLYGDDIPTPFSYRTSAVRNTMICYGTQTSGQTHEILQKGFEQSPMFTGRIQGKGPRYCPSIEDKINRFRERNSHTIVLEKEALHAETVYVNGFSTSLPVEVQEEGLHSIPGLENCVIVRHGYAVEYDFFFPYQVNPTLETKAISGLYFAGQINGTSGYEEAATQGLVAGINAARKIQGRDSFTLRRDEAYIGVLIDDLNTKSTEEPYRIFTSLAEHRLILRPDNVYARLMKYGHDFGLVSEYDYDLYHIAEQRVTASLAELKTVFFSPANANPVLESVGENTIQQALSAAHILKRPAIKIRNILPLLPERNSLLSDYELQRIEIEAKYEGYISKDMQNIRSDIYEMKIPLELDYSLVHSLSTESKEKLTRLRPPTLGAASRISGVSASDISILSLYLKN